jgi:hypothetical protein
MSWEYFVLVPHIKLKSVQTQFWQQGAVDLNVKLEIIHLCETGDLSKNEITVLKHCFSNLKNRDKI